MTSIPGAVRDLVGDYQRFVADLLAELRAVGISPPPGPVSHLGYKAPTWDDYRRVRNGLGQLARGRVENEHNGRPIAKVMLAGELPLATGFTGSLVEVMPPKSTPAPLAGLEHCGFVIGGDLEEFAATHRAVLTGRQDQGPFCRPVYVRFSSGRRAKFYEYPLAEVVRLEGREFVAPS
jgi:predicted metalloenzyme YecM